MVPHLTYEQGALGAIAIAAGLLGRERTGLGRAVTVSGLHAVSAMNATIMVDLPGSVRPFGGPKASLTGGPNFRMYQCRDGRWLFIAALTPSFFGKALDAMGLRSVMDRPGIDGDFGRLRDPRAPTTGRRAGRGSPTGEGSSDWLAIFDQAGVPNAPIESRDQWRRSQTVAANQGLITVDHSELGPVVLPDIAVELSVTPGRVDGLADRKAMVLPADVWADAADQPRPTTGPSNPPALPLAGLKVFDLGSFLAGPFVSDILGDFGATVVKVEHPDGDGYRAVPSAFAAMNKGKRNLSIDLKQDGARDVLLRLVRDADVVIDNVRVGIPERLGTHYEALHQVNPDIVRCTVTGWGAGPLRETPCFDPLLQARSGLMAAQGGDGDPVLHAMPVHDVGAATLAAFGAVAALFARRLIGRGQEVRTSLTQASLMQQAGEMTTFSGAPVPLERRKGLPRALPGQRLYRCRDGWIAVNAGDQGAAALQSGLSAAPGGSRRSRRTQPEPLLADLNIEDALDALAAASVAAVKVLGRNDIFDDRWLAENHFFTPVQDSEHGRMMIVTGYADWGCPRAPERGRSHALGADAEAILRHLDPVRSKGGVQ